jgi:ribonuclease HI
MKVTAYTDGAAIGNPGPGGYGVVLLAPELGLRKEISAGYRLTTNNRMELLAVVVALESLKHKGTKIVIYSDSQYVVNAVEKGWLRNWVQINFKGKKNEDLWRRYLKVAQYHQVTLKWVKGHAGIAENERCDQLATQQAQSNPLLVDEFYEQNQDI